MARSPLLEIHFLTLWICVVFSAGSLSHAQVFPGVLGPMPHPPENPPTSEKIRLGQFLFWDEQLSSDNSTACGTCHLPEVGGGDPRAFEPFAAHPGTDAIFGTEDDVRGSVGVPRQSCDGSPLHDPTFGWARRVTSRQAPSMIAAGFSPLSFWDGRATGEFRDPLSGDLLIASGVPLSHRWWSPRSLPWRWHVRGEIGPQWWLNSQPLPRWRSLAIYPWHGVQLFSLTPITPASSRARSAPLRSLRLESHWRSRPMNALSFPTKLRSITGMRANKTL